MADVMRATARLCGSLKRVPHALTRNTETVTRTPLNLQFRHLDLTLLPAGRIGLSQPGQPDKVHNIVEMKGRRDKDQAPFQVPSQPDLSLDRPAVSYTHLTLPTN